jgi:uncharacterized hydrophobic protein (TIGR00271 family)
MLEALFNNVSEPDKNTAIADIIEHAAPRKDFFLMLVLAVSMAAFGILLDSTVILVGSMLVAPLLYPVLSLALGVITADTKIVATSFVTILKSTGFAVAAGFVIGFLFSTHGTTPLSILGAAGTTSPLSYTLVAVIAGLAAAFATTKPYLNETLPGVAIAVALVPPLADAGIALSGFAWGEFSTALLLFIVNVVGIVFSAMIVFAMMHFAVKKPVAERVAQKEEKIIEKESQPKAE